MHSLLALSFLLAVISAVYSEDESYKSDYYDLNPWKPILKPIEDRLKPVKVTPKYDDKYLFHNVAGKPYVVAPYPGIYTFPYYAFVKNPVYPPPPVYNPYPAYSNGNYYVRKDVKEKPYVSYYK